MLSQLSLLGVSLLPSLSLIHPLPVWRPFPEDLVSTKSLLSVTHEMSELLNVNTWITYMKASANKNGIFLFNKKCHSITLRTISKPFSSC